MRVPLYDTHDADEEFIVSGTALRLHSQERPPYGIGRIDEPPPRPRRWVLQLDRVFPVSKDRRTPVSQGETRQVYTKHLQSYDSNSHQIVMSKMSDSKIVMVALMIWEWIYK